MSVEEKGALSNYQWFAREFYSGSDAYIFFNNRYIDQVVSLQFQLQENIAPIYGYASYTYDAVARGTRLVSGSFRINFVESMYLYSAMQLLVKDERVYSGDVVNTSMSGLTAEQIASLANNASYQNLLRLASENEARLWGREGQPVIDRYRKPFFLVNASNSESEVNLRENGFDIVIGYGKKNLTFGDTLNTDSTIKIINNVQITSVTQVIQPTGDPIFEEYGFIGRDLDNTIGVKR